MMNTGESDGVRTDDASAAAALPSAATTTRSTSVSLLLSTRGNPTPEKDIDCVICAEKARAIFCFPCGHYTCYICGLRMLRMEQNCPVCRKTSKNSVLTTRVSIVEGQYCPEEVDFMRSKATFDVNLSCFVDSPALAVEMAKLYLPLCPLSSCWNNGMQKPFATEKGLKMHLQHDHHLFYCFVCLRRRPLFLAEQTLYTHAELELHQAGMLDTDPVTFSGHPCCSFCGDHTLYLDGEDLMKHMINQHFSCDFCNRDQFTFTFFRTRANMYEHFRTCHKLCDHPKCAGLETILRAYRDEFDLDLHRQREHNARPSTFKPSDFQQTSSGDGGMSPVTTGIHSTSRYPPLGNPGVSRSGALPPGGPSSPSSSLPSHTGGNGHNDLRSGGGRGGGGDAGTPSPSVSTAANLAVTRITFDYLDHQSVLDLAPKDRSSLDRGRGGARTRRNKRGGGGHENDAAGGGSGGGRGATRSVQKAGLPSHFLSPLSTVLTSLLHRHMTPEEIASLPRTADASPSHATSTSSSSPSSSNQMNEPFTVSHGHWGNHPRVIRPYIPQALATAEMNEGESKCGDRNSNEEEEERSRGGGGDIHFSDRNEKQWNANAEGAAAPNMWKHENSDARMRTNTATTIPTRGGGISQPGENSSSSTMATATQERPFNPQQRLDALLHRHLPSTREYDRFKNETRHYMQSNIKTSEYYDLLCSFFSFEVLEEFIPLFIASCPMEDKRVALRELWKMKTSPEMVRQEKVRREEEEAAERNKKGKNNNNHHNNAATMVTSNSITSGGGGEACLHPSGEVGRGRRMELDTHPDGGSSAEKTQKEELTYIDEVRHAVSMLLPSSKGFPSSAAYDRKSSGVYPRGGRGDGGAAAAVSYAEALGTKKKAAPDAMQGERNVPYSHKNSNNSSASGMSWASKLQSESTSGKKAEREDALKGNSTSGKDYSHFQPHYPHHTDHSGDVVDDGTNEYTTETRIGDPNSNSNSNNNNNNRGTRHPSDHSSYRSEGEEDCFRTPEGRRWRRPQSGGDNDKRSGGGGPEPRVAREEEEEEEERRVEAEGNNGNPCNKDEANDAIEMKAAYSTNAMSSGGKQQQQQQWAAQLFEKKLSPKAGGESKRSTSSSTANANATSTVGKKKGIKLIKNSGDTCTSATTAPNYPTLWEGITEVRQPPASFSASLRGKTSSQWVDASRPNWSSVVGSSSSSTSTPQGRSSTSAADHASSSAGGGGGGGWGGSASSSSSPSRTVPSASRSTHADVSSTELFPSLFSEEEKRRRERQQTMAAAVKQKVKPQLNAWFPGNKKA